MTIDFDQFDPIGSCTPLLINFNKSPSIYIENTDFVRGTKAKKQKTETKRSGTKPNTGICIFSKYTCIQGKGTKP